MVAGKCHWIIPVSYTHLLQRWFPWLVILRSGQCFHQIPAWVSVDIMKKHCGYWEFTCCFLWWQWRFSISATKAPIFPGWCSGIFIVLTWFWCIFPDWCWKCISLSIIGWETAAGGFWYWPVSYTHLVSVINSQFEKDGIIYRVKPDYINSAMNYLRQDDIDLMPEDVPVSYTHLVYTDRSVSRQ